MLSQKLIIILIIICCIINCLPSFGETQLNYLGLFSKILTYVLLFLFGYSNYRESEEQESRIMALVNLGLLFSFIADLLLFFKANFASFFFFFLVPTCYTCAIFPSKPYNFKWIAIFPFSIILVLFDTNILPLIDPTLKIPTILFSISFVIAVWLSAERTIKLHTNSSKYNFLGYISFMFAAVIFTSTKTFVDLDLDDLITFPLFVFSQVLILYSLKTEKKKSQKELLEELMKKKN
ncbi:hypothetical protein M0813_11857 [Anaeramoeba flamelloides]|uniref:YhhN-like protein n=1 Tax=Anaeramoeba flamelloides TaxID=1746091 RepID=A0ABQ8ZE85_9EUKA|nr:hypothetical protein M0813_11857 [Anaeramoeba flamelloides]